MAPCTVAPPVAQPARPEPSSASIDPAIQTLCEVAAERAGLRLSEAQMFLMYRGAPLVLDILEGLKFDRDLANMPAVAYRAAN